VTDCVVNCAAINIAVGDDGTTKLGAGVGIENKPGSAVGDYDDCQTAPGYYLRVKTTDSKNLGSAKIQRAPANYYAPGGQVISGNTVFADGPEDIDFEEDATNSLVSLCPFAGTSAAGSNALADCTPDCSTTNTNSNAIAFHGFCVCDVGAYALNMLQDSTNGAAAAGACTLCSETFTAAGAGVTTTGIGSTADTACTTAPGYIINYPATNSVTKSLITVVKAPAGHYAVGGTTLLATATSSNIPQKASVCPANTNSVEGSAFCTCNDGHIPALGGGCQPFDVSVTATAAAAVAESAGASTPIAVALAAAAAVPLLL
jgi:hypothetical protein